MASLNLQSVARCFKTATYWLTLSTALRARLSNSYLATKADFWGFNCFCRRSTIVSYVRESSLNNIGAIKSFANWYVSGGRLVDRTAFFCFDSVTPLATKKNSSCSAYSSKSAPTANLILNFPDVTNRIWCRIRLVWHLETSCGSFLGMSSLL